MSARYYDVTLLSLLNSFSDLNIIKHLHLCVYEGVDFEPKWYDTKKL